jgi:VanZ family protein
VIHFSSSIRWMAALFWMALIFFGSSIPADSLPEGPQFISIVVHLLEFFILTLLLIWAINGGFNEPVILPVKCAAALLAVFFGITDEVHQLFVPGRVSDLLDLAVDSIGVVLAVILVPLIQKRIEERYARVAEDR